MINLYALKIFREGMIKLNKCGHYSIVTSIDDDNDLGWIERFVVIALGDFLTVSTSHIPKSWSYTRKLSSYHSFTVLKEIPPLLNFIFSHFSYPLGFLVVGNLT